MSVVWPGRRSMCTSWLTRSPPSLEGMEVPLRVAVMGCVVNGPGEAREADLGVASGNGKGEIFVKGQIIKTVPEHEIVGHAHRERPCASSRKRASRPKLARPHRHRLLVLRDIAEEDRARRKRAVLHQLQRDPLVQRREERRAAADRGRGDHHVELVHEAGPDQRRGERGAGHLDQRRRSRP